MDVGGPNQYSARRQRGVRLIALSRLSHWQIRTIMAPAKPTISKANQTPKGTFSSGDFGLVGLVIWCASSPYARVPLMPAAL
jgi:hypothetical protein